MQTALPSSVKKQAERAKELQAGITQPAPANGGDQPGNTETPAPGEVDVLKTENARLNAEVTRLAKANQTLQDKYNAEVPRYASDLRELKAQVKQLSEDNARLKTAPPAAAPATVDPATLDLLQFYTQEDVNLYGEKLLRGMLASTLKTLEPLKANLVEAAKSAARTEIDPIKADVKEERERREREAATHLETRQAKYVAELQMEIPDWETQNTDPGFLGWLDKFDATHGASRMKVLQNAFHAMDSATTIEIFKAFREGREIGAAAPTPQPNLDPGPGGGGGNPPTQGKKQWTRAEITEFYKLKKLGRYKGREAEARRLEEDIIAAGQERRISG